MRLADTVFAECDGKSDWHFAGAVTSIARSLTSAQYFELSGEVSEACNKVFHDKPASILAAQPLMRLPYEKVWAETQTARGTRIGCLFEAEAPRLDRGTMTFLWSSPTDPCKVGVNPMGTLFDWHPNADLVRELENNPGVVLGRQVALPDASELMREFDVDMNYVNSMYKLLSHTAGVGSPHCNEYLDHRFSAAGFSEEALSVETASCSDSSVNGCFFWQAFICLLNSRQGLDETHDDLNRLNRRREKAGKRPLCEFTVTRLKLSRSQVNRAAAHGISRQTARQHLVRGHFKVRKNGIYWWSPFIRGTGAPVIRSHYEVRN